MSWLQVTWKTSGDHIKWIFSNLYQQINSMFSNFFPPINFFLTLRQALLMCWDSFLNIEMIWQKCLSTMELIALSPVNKLLRGMCLPIIVELTTQLWWLAELVFHTYIFVEINRIGGMVAGVMKDPLDTTMTVFRHLSTHQATSFLCYYTTSGRGLSAKTLTWLFLSF